MTRQSISKAKTAQRRREIREDRRAANQELSHLCLEEVVTGDDAEYDSSEIHRDQVEGRFRLATRSVLEP